MKNYYDIPFVFTDASDKVILKSAHAHDKLEKIFVHDDLSVLFSQETKSILAKLSFDSHAIVALRSLKKFKFAYVTKKRFLGTELHLFVFLDTNKKETALLELEAEQLCQTIKNEKEYADPSNMSPYVYTLSRAVSDFVKGYDLPALSSTIGEVADDLIRGAERSYLFGKRVVYDLERGCLPGQEIFISYPVLNTVLLFLLCELGELSSGEEIHVLFGYRDASLVIGISADIDSKINTVFRDVDISDCGMFKEESRFVLSLCSALSGAMNGRVSVSLEAIGEKNRLLVSYVLKSYDKRPSGIKEIGRAHV